MNESNLETMAMYSLRNIRSDVIDVCIRLMLQCANGDFHPDNNGGAWIEWFGPKENIIVCVYGGDKLVCEVYLAEVDSEVVEHTRFGMRWEPKNFDDALDSVKRVVREQRVDIGRIEKYTALYWLPGVRLANWLQTLRGE